MIILACIAVISSVYAQENLTALIKEVSPSVVLVITYDEEGEELSGGSGFFISEDGDVITNRHVIQGAYYAEVKTADEKVYDIKEVLAEDKDGDLIRLSVDIPRDAVHVLGISDSLPEVGERVIVVGNPLGLEQTVSDGIVSAVREIPAFGNIIQITAPISAGSSGSPVVNMRGEAIGVASFQMVEGQNLNFAIPGQMIIALSPTDSLTLSQWSEAKFEDWLESSDRLYLWGLYSYWDEEYEAAIDYLKKAIEKNPQDAEAHSLMGDCYCELERWYEAIAAYKKAVEIDSKNAEAYAGLGWAYGELGRYNESIEASRQAIRLDSDLYWAYNNLGWIYGELERWNEAVDACKRAIRINPDDAVAYNNLGWAYGNLGLYHEEMEVYKQVIRINPDDADAHYNLGNVYICLGRYYEAIEAYKQAIYIKSDYSDAYSGLGLAYGTLGRYYEAIGAYKQAIRINPEDVWAYSGLGLAYLGIGLYTEAIEAYKQAIHLNPDYAHAHYYLGMAYVETGNKISALQEYKILKGLDVELANQLFNLIYP